MTRRKYAPGDRVAWMKPNSITFGTVLADEGFFYVVQVDGNKKGPNRCGEMAIDSAERAIVEGWPVKGTR